MALSSCAQEGQWAVEKGQDPITDAPFAEAWVPSEAENGRLLIGCSAAGDPPSILIQTSRRVGGYSLDNNFIERKADVRFDQQKPFTTNVIIGDDAINFQKGLHGLSYRHGQMLAGLPSVKKVAVQVDDWQNRRLQMTFDVSGAQTAIEEVAKHCKAQ